MRRHAPRHPCGKRPVGDAEECGRRWWQRQAVGERRGRVAPDRHQLRRQPAEYALAVAQHHAVEVDQLADPVGHPVRGHRDGDAAEAVADQDDVGDLFRFQEVREISGEDLDRSRGRASGGARRARSGWA